MAETADVLALTDRLIADHIDEPPPEFLGAQFDAGLAFVHFPVGYGGLGLSPKFQRDVQLRIADAGGPSPRHDIGYGMAAPTLVTHGSDEQKRRYLRPLFTAEEIWCQLFSEPAAGSDVAGLATRAIRDGDEWIVNGQKVWTSLAHEARWGLLLARTDPTAPKHRGLSYFVIDMHGPGVEVRPLRQITGMAEFNEVYFTDARVPDAERLDDVGKGWNVALTTLMNERVSIGGGAPPRGSGVIAHAVDAWKRYGHNDPARRDELMKLWTRCEAARLTNLRASAARSQSTPGPEGSVGKLAMAELNKEVSAFAVSLMGPAGQLFPAGYEFRRPTFGAAMGNDDSRSFFMRARANSIEGGTSEVMRNILGERVLGLPGDVRVDKDLAWSDIPRS